MKETASPRRPQFFKVFLPEHSSDHLKIPVSFVHHIDGGGGSLNTVSLKGPGGGVWYADLVINSGELFFGKGWKEFISDNSVQFGDFLVFEYAGNMRFNVLVFDHSACDKEASLLARPSCDKFTPKRKRGRQPGKKFDDEQFLYSEKNRSGVISQRLPVTLEEVSGVLQKANAFKSERPFGIIEMRDSYVYFGFALTIPTNFAREHLPWPCGNVILWDPSGKRWEVKSLNHGRTCRLSGGWRQFSIANNLETGDFCVFEVIDKYEIKVHILRVVEELKPLIRESRGRIKQPLLQG